MVPPGLAEEKHEEKARRKIGSRGVARHLQKASKLQSEWKFCQMWLRIFTKSSNEKDYDVNTHDDTDDEKSPR